MLTSYTWPLPGVIIGDSLSVVPFMSGEKHTLGQVRLWKSLPVVNGGLPSKVWKICGVAKWFGFSQY